MKIRPNLYSRISLLLSFIAVNAFALWIISVGGAVRDVPELDIRKGKADSTVYECYTDRIYNFDKEFGRNIMLTRCNVLYSLMAHCLYSPQTVTS